MQNSSPYAALLEAARKVWPEAWVDEQEFGAYVSERSAGPSADRRDAASLYLACACVKGLGPAIRAFEDGFVIEIERAGARARLPPDDIKELAQSLRHDLLVGREGSRPKLAEYSGRGDLRGWLRVTAMRAALKILRRRRGHASDEQVQDVRSTGDDPEVRYMKELYGEAFRSAFTSAVATLDPRDRSVLRQSVVEGKSIDEIGAEYHVHRATAARWVQAARENLLVAVRRDFSQKAQVTAHECDSVLRLVQSRFDLTLRRLLT